MRRLLFANLALVLAASCAQAEDSGKKDETASVYIPKPEPEAGVDGTTPDASTDEDAAPVLPCTAVDWCPEESTVSSQYAFTAIWGTSKTDVWAVGSGGTIAHYDGTGWTKTPTGVKNTFRAVWGSGPSDVYAVSMTNVIVHSKGWSGPATAWTPLPAAGEEGDWPQGVFAVWGSSADDVRIGIRTRMIFDPNTGEYAATNQYALERVDDPDAGAATVAWKGIGGDGTVNGIWGSASDDVWIVADNSERNGWEKGITRHGVGGEKGGLVWTNVDSQSTVALRAIWGSSKDDVWAVGDRGTIRHMKNGAQRWEVVDSPTSADLYGLWGSSGSDIWAVGDAGTILHFDGATWKPSTATFNQGLAPNLRGVWGSSASDVWIVGGNATLHYTGGTK
jgi:hypothetical protein